MDRGEKKGTGEEIDCEMSDRVGGASRRHREIEKRRSQIRLDHCF